MKTLTKDIELHASPKDGLAFVKVTALADDGSGPLVGYSPVGDGLMAASHIEFNGKRHTVTHVDPV